MNRTLRDVKRSGTLNEFLVDEIIKALQSSSRRGRSFEDALTRQNKQTTQKMSERYEEPIKPKIIWT